MDTETVFEEKEKETYHGSPPLENGSISSAEDVCRYF